MPKYKIFSFIISFFLVVASLTPFDVAYGASGVPITAPTAILMDAKSNRVIYSKTPHLKRKPASTTKVLTAIVTVEHLSLDAIVTVPSFVGSIEPSKIYLKPGEKYYVRDLLRAILLKSANDAAETLAVGVAGSRAKFARMMTRKAKAIGAKNSNFVNASGLPAKGQYSTAYDMARIMKHAQKYPFLVETMRKKDMMIYSRGGRKVYIKNHNKMLWRDPREVLGKTGWTRRAKHCFVGRVNVAGNKVYIAIMGSHSLWRDLKKLIDWRFGNVHRIIRTNRKLWSTAETKKIQTALKRSGYTPGTIDGVWGSKTVAAVKRFQRTKKLRADGIVGKQTWAKLKRYL